MLSLLRPLSPSSLLSLWLSLSQKAASSMLSKERPRRRPRVVVAMHALQVHGDLHIFFSKIIQKCKKKSITLRFELTLKICLKNTFYYDCIWFFVYNVFVMYSQGAIQREPAHAISVSHCILSVCLAQRKRARGLQFFSTLSSFNVPSRLQLLERKALWFRLSLFTCWPRLHLCSFSARKCVL